MIIPIKDMVVPIYGEIVPYKFYPIRIIVVSVVLCNLQGAIGTVYFIKKSNIRVILRSFMDNYMSQTIFKVGEKADGKITHRKKIENITYIV